MSLSEKLLSTPPFPQLVQDCVDFLQQEVNSKSGISGMAIKTAFKVLVKVKAGILEDVMRYLLPFFVDALEPFYKKFQESGASDFGQYLQQHTKEVVQALLAVTDEKVANANNKVLRSGYQKLRGIAEKQVSEAIPGIASLLKKYV